MRLLFALAGLVAVATPCAAQDAPVPVFYTFRPDGWDVRPMDKAMHAALSRPDFVLRTKITPDALVLTVPEEPAWVSRKERTRYSFMLVFTRDGDKIGQSEEECAVADGDACADQIAADIKGAAQVGH